ncbi:MAG: hypothetical protein ABI147_14650 [Acidobacteriaceae bacterium]
MTLQKARLIRWAAMSYVALSVAMIGLYGFNRGTMRQVVLVAAVALVFATVTLMFIDRRRYSCDHGLEG